MHFFLLVRINKGFNDRNRKSKEPWTQFASCRASRHASDRTSVQSAMGPIAEAAAAKTHKVFGQRMFVSASRHEIALSALDGPGRRVTSRTVEKRETKFQGRGVPCGLR